jgi:hypothetical protein
VGSEVYAPIDYKKIRTIFREELDKPIGTPVDQYSGAVSLPATTWTDLLTYTVPEGKTLYISEFGGFCPTQDYQIKLLIGGTEKRVVGNPAKTPIQYVFVNPIPVPAGTTIKVQGYAAAAATAYGWLNGFSA